MEHKIIRSENGEVHYWIVRQDAPGAKCLVFTHGLTADHTMFEKQVRHFRSSCTVIVWDVPLHGLSRPYRNFSYRETARELKHILDNEGVGKAVLAGMSMGGYPCQMFADLYPERVEGFVAIDTTPFGLAYYSKSDLRWLRWAAPLARLFPCGMLKESMARSVSVTEDSRRIMREMLSPLTKAQVVEQMGIAYGQFAAENRDMTFHFPVLLLLGDRDKTGKVRQYTQAWAARTGYPLRIIQNAAHFSNSDNSEQVNAEIDAFLAEL